MGSGQRVVHRALHRRFTVRVLIRVVRSTCIPCVITDFVLLDLDLFQMCEKFDKLLFLALSHFILLGCMSWLGHHGCSCIFSHGPIDSHDAILFEALSQFELHLALVQGSVIENALYFRSHGWILLKGVR